MPPGAPAPPQRSARHASPDSATWLSRVYDATVWYWDSFVHAGSYGSAYRALLERLREDGRLSDAPSRVLDCGIGAGVFSEALVRTLGVPARLYGVDLSRRLLERAAARLRAAGASVQLARGDARALPFPDGQMDAVLCGLVLDHLGAASGALRELARVARPGAPIVVVTTRPLAPDLPFRAVFRYRHLDPAAVERAMTAAGLCDVRRHALTGLARPFGIAFTGRAATAPR
jgi:ubiquinone/menaquinone biosynthesis C-methylase UbiE